MAVLLSIDSLKGWLGGALHIEKIIFFGASLEMSFYRLLSKCRVPSFESGR